MSMRSRTWPPAVLRVGAPSNRLLRFGLTAALAVVAVTVFIQLLRTDSFGLDLSIILDASQRWMEGGDPYLAVTGPETNGAPFLQPPYFLPIAAPLTFLPRPLVLIAWTILLVVAAILALRRLGVPLLLVPAVLAWPPFQEGLYFGNVQVLSFAAFAFLLWRAHAEADPPLEPQAIDLPTSHRAPLLEGSLASAIALLKITQVFPWVHLLGRRPVAALAGAIVAAMIVGATVLVTGTQLWVAWLDLLAAASAKPEIGWTYSLIAPLGTGWEVLVLALAAVGALMVRGPRAGLLVGILLVIASPSLRMHGLEFLLPAMLFIRRELALVGALLISIYVGTPVWFGLFVVVGATVAALRVSGLREPVPVDSLAELSGERSAASRVISM
jgi:hypothetical protein